MLHKIPHLFTLEVMCCFSNTQYDRWDEWLGPLALSIDSMSEDFLERLAQRDSIISVAQGGL